MMRRSRSAWMVFSVAALWAWSQEARAEVHVAENVTYGKAGDVELKLDLARPAGEGPFPGLVFIHGGGWAGGNRVRFRKEIEVAAERGYVAATLSYRLNTLNEAGQPRHPFPAQVEDVKAAVRFLRASAGKYRLDPQRIGATGDSAGGHLSLMLGLTDAGAKLEGNGGQPDQSSRVQAVVNIFGPTDMTHLHATSPGAAPILERFLRGKPDAQSEAYRLSSPITHVSKDDPPVLTIHGDADKLVPPDQASRLEEAMKKAGVEHTTLLLKGEGHGFKGPANTEAREAVYRFFDKHLQGK